MGTSHLQQQQPRPATPSFHLQQQQQTRQSPVAGGMPNPNIQSNPNSNAHPNLASLPAHIRQQLYVTQDGRLMRPSLNGQAIQAQAGGPQPLIPGSAQSGGESQMHPPMQRIASTPTIGAGGVAGGSGMGVRSGQGSNVEGSNIGMPLGQRVPHFGQPLQQPGQGQQFGGSVGSGDGAGQQRQHQGQGQGQHNPGSYAGAIVSAPGTGNPGVGSMGTGGIIPSSISNVVPPPHPPSAPPSVATPGGGRLGSRPGSRTQTPAAHLQQQQQQQQQQQTQQQQTQNVTTRSATSTPALSSANVAGLSSSLNSSAARGLPMARSGVSGDQAMLQSFMQIGTPRIGGRALNGSSGMAGFSGNPGAKTGGSGDVHAGVKRAGSPVASHSAIRLVLRSRLTDTSFSTSLIG
jgi:hypothetical protein